MWVILCLERSLARSLCNTLLLFVSIGFLLGWVDFWGGGVTGRRCGGRAFWRWFKAMLMQPVQQYTIKILNLKDNFVENSLIYISNTSNANPNVQTTLNGLDSRTALLALLVHIRMSLVLRIKWILRYAE